MSKLVTKFKATAYKHCIIKEELIISDSDDEGDKEPVDETIDTDFSNSEVEATINQKRQSGRLGSKKVNGQVNKQSTLDLSLKSKTSKSSEQSATSKNVKDNEKPTVESFVSDNIDLLLKKHTKSYCRKCKVKRAVIRRKARCPNCKTQLSYSCDSCNKTYPNFTDLGYHLKANHTKSRKLHVCPKCGKTFAYRRGLREHHRTRHQPRGQCEKCGKKFALKHKREHEKICDKESPYKCEKCPFTANYRSNLVAHVGEKHSGFSEKCAGCDKLFTNVRSLRRHRKIYCKKIKSLECDHCGHKVYRKDQMVIHLDQVHFDGCPTTSESRACDYCGVSLESHERMGFHLKRCELAPLELRRRSENTGRASRMCQHCGESLGRFERMRIHLERCVLAPREFRREPYGGSRTCKYCDVTLKRYEHMRYHLGRCESAPLEFRRQPGTTDQPDIDTAMKNLARSYCVKCKSTRPLKFRVRRCGECDSRLKIICERCPKSFRELYPLREHLRIKHVTVTTFFRCDKCRCSYSRKKNLKMHQRKCHSTQSTVTKNYECAKCDRSYGNKASLRKHIISCSQEPKFFCDKCPYKTHFKSSLVDHMRAKRATCV